MINPFAKVTLEDAFTVSPRELRVCKRKRSYKSQAKARQMAVVISRNIGSKQTPYLCRVCNRWHLTKK